MFTGIIQTQGEIIQVRSKADDVHFVIRPFTPFSSLQQGESIAANGVCLTVVSFTESQYTVFASKATLLVTTLSSWRPGSIVNLERALALGDRLGGHMVSGHIDCIATVRAAQQVAASKQYELAFPNIFSSQVVPKGSITLDGISLTVTACGAGWLTVNIIPATQQSTTITAWKVDTQVTMETDIIGKYVLNAVQAMLSGQKDTATVQADSALTMDFLREHGF